MIIISLMIKKLALCLIKCRMLKPAIIVRMDGGVCSQMHFFIIGQYFCDKGYTVKYDLSWFKSYGRDANGIRQRNFSLLSAFPSLKKNFKEASQMEIFLYKGFSYVNNYKNEDKRFDYLKIVPPMYLSSYYPFTKEMLDEMMPKYFTFTDAVLNIRSRKYCEKIRKCKVPVAIHVRRGDLAEYRDGYGSPVPTGFFQKAIDYIFSLYREASFFFFSDDVDYVKNVLIPNLYLPNSYTVIEGNSDENGYMDLMLISECKHMIASKGAFGKYGGFIKSDPDTKIFIMNDEDERRKWKDRSKKINFI